MLEEALQLGSALEEVRSRVKTGRIAIDFDRSRVDSKAFRTDFNGIPLSKDEKRWPLTANASAPVCGQPVPLSSGSLELRKSCFEVVSMLWM